MDLSDPAYVFPDPEKIVKYALDHGKKNDPSGILQAIDEYCMKYARRSMNVGNDKGLILDQVFQERDPMVALELGSFVGYSAIRMSRFLKEGGKLYCIEIDSQFAKFVECLVNHAGLSDKVSVIVGPSSAIIPNLKAEYGINKLDFIFIDHLKTLYKPDMIRIIENDLLENGSVILADNVIYPGSPDYLEFIRNNPQFKSVFFKSNLEYMPEIEDGLEKSIFIG